MSRGPSPELDSAASAPRGGRHDRRQSPRVEELLLSANRRLVVLEQLFRLAALDPDGNPFAGSYVPDLCLGVAEILSDVEESIEYGGGAPGAGGSLMLPGEVLPASRHGGSSRPGHDLLEITAARATIPRIWITERREPTCS